MFISFYIALLLWYRGEMHLVLSNGSISMIENDGTLSIKQIVVPPFKVKTAIPYLK